MNLNELKKLLTEKNENEHIEFKEAKNTFSVLGSINKPKCIYGYCVAIGNEGGGKLILGVNNQKTIVGTKTCPNPEDIKSKVFNALRKRIEIDEILNTENKRVIIIHIPSKSTGELLKFHGIPLMRIGEELKEMDNETQRNILLEHIQDYSAEIVSGANYKDLNPNAIKEMEKQYNKKNNTKLSGKQFLNDLRLITNTGITYAGLILLGNASAIAHYLGAAEIIFQYRSNKNNIEYEDRENFRNAFLLEEEKIWQKINLRNQVTQIQEGFLTKEIPAFSKKSIKEAILNAITHRDYAKPGSVIIKQSPQEFEIQSPGGFLEGINTSNILNKTQPRNRLIAETLEKLGFVQRAGQGMDTIFKESLNAGKGMPDLSSSDRHEVNLKISAKVKNLDFLKYLQRVTNEKQITLSLDEIILLQSIEEDGKNLNKNQVNKFLKLGIIEAIGRTRGIRYILSHNFYKTHGTTGKYTRIAGITRDTKKTLILQHLKKNKSGAVLSDFTQAFPEISRQDISNILQELKKDKKIKVEGPHRWAKWKSN